MNQNKTVCICSAYYYPHFGGVERYAENMANYLAKNDCNVVVLTTSVGAKAGMETRDDIIIYRLPVLKLLHGRYPLPAIFSKEYRSIMSTFRSHNFSLFILNTRFYLTTMIALFLSQQKNSKAIIIEHGTGHIKTGNFLFDRAGIIFEHAITWIQHTFFKPAYYGVSEACNRWLLHFGIKANGVIYNGIDVEGQQENTQTREHRPQTEGVRKNYLDFINKRSAVGGQQSVVLFTFAGRLIAEKGILFILDLFQQFCQKYPEAYLFVAGTGPLLEEAEKFKNERIVILGKLDHTEVMNLLSYTDVVLIPSDYPEGLPTLILEGGFSKCAVIATDRGGAKEVIATDQLGFIIPDPDKKQFFAAMEKLMLDPQLRESLKNALHHRVVTKFSWNEIIKGVLEILNQQTGSKHK